MTEPSRAQLSAWRTEQAQCLVCSLLASVDRQVPTRAEDAERSALDALQIAHWETRHPDYAVYVATLK